MICSKKILRMLNKVRIAVVKFITGLAIMLFMVGASAIDSPDARIPYAMCIGSLVWLILVGVANDWFDYERGDIE